jgi:predicted transcriptional regulator of viral defense system
MSFASMMEMRISDAPMGSAFIVSDFTDIMDYETAKKNIARMEKNGKLRRVIRGVYDKPKYSTLLQEYSAPNPNEIADALARNYSWTIAPTGNTALNLLGLSTQVPANWSYISSGPYKKYEIGKVRIDFVHRADRELSGMSSKTQLIIQAIKELGRERIGNDEVRKIRSKLSDEEKEIMMKESQQTTAWVYSVIKDICKGELQ